MAEIFNDFFVWFKFSSKIPKAKRPFNTYLRKIVVKSFFTSPVQESEAEKLITNLNQNISLCPFHVAFLLKS